MFRCIHLGHNVFPRNLNQLLFTGFQFNGHPTFFHDGIKDPFPILRPIVQVSDVFSYFSYVAYPLGLSLFFLL